MRKLAYPLYIKQVQTLPCSWQVYRRQQETNLLDPFFTKQPQEKPFRLNSVAHTYRLLTWSNFIMSLVTLRRILFDISDVNLVSKETLSRNIEAILDGLKEGGASSEMDELHDLLFASSNPPSVLKYLEASFDIYDDKKVGIYMFIYTVKF